MRAAQAATDRATEACKPTGPPRCTTRVWGTLAILFLSFLWRAPIDGYTDFLVNDNDSLYHLKRIEQCMAHYPAVVSRDPYCHFPSDYRVHWLAPHTLLYATLGKAARLSPSQREQLIKIVSWVPVLAGVLSVWLALQIAALYTNKTRFVLLAGWVLAFCGNHFWITRYGAIDHHTFECLGVVCLMLGRLRKSLWIWAGGAFVLLAMSPAGSLYATLAVAIMAGAELLAACRKSDTELTRPMGWLLLPAAAALAVLLMHRALDPEPLPMTAFSWFHFSLFQPAWLAAVGAAASGGIVLCRHPGTGMSPKRLVWTAVAVGGGVVGIGLVFLWLSGQLQPIWERLAFTRRLPVGEEFSPLGGGLIRAPGWSKVVLLVEFYLVGTLVRALRKGEASSMLFARLALASTVAIGLLEYRHLRVMSPFVAIGLSLAVNDTLRWLTPLPMFAGRGWRYVPVTLLAIVTVPAFLSFSVGTRRDANRWQRERRRFTDEITTWLRTETPPPDAAPDPTPLYGVFCPWDVGHHVNVLGERPVVVDPFNNMDVAEASMEVWLAETTEQLAQALDRYRVRYVVMAKPEERTLTMLGLLRTDISGLVQLAPSLPGGFVFMPDMERFAAYRLFIHAGLSSDIGRFQPRFFASFDHRLALAVPGAPARISSVPFAQIYELKPGAILTGTAPVDTQTVTIACHIQYADSRADRQCEFRIVPSPAGEFEFHTALPAPVTESSFRVPAAYTIRAGSLQARVQVTQTDVDQGRRVKVEWNQQQ